MSVLKGYKVVSVHGEELWSWRNKAHYKISGAVCYGRETWTRPDKFCGPLAVFATQASASAFRDEYAAQRNAEVWQCEYEASSGCRMWTTVDGFRLQHAPEGTILAEAVKLVRRVA